MTDATAQTVARLALEDGTVFTGAAFGAVDRPDPAIGEVVFNTSMTGYQEILTDPSYSGQIVTMTYPHIGNYGVNLDDLESTKAQAAGFIVKSLAPHVSNYRATERLEKWLADQGVIGITGIDTRALTRKLRTQGAMRGVLAAGDHDPRKLVEAALASPNMAGQNLAEQVSRGDVGEWTEDLGEWQPIQGVIEADDKRFKVVAIDCGIKANILRNLSDRGCEIICVPHDTPADQIMAMKPEGLFVSNGPGDPAPVETTIETLRAIAGKVPTFGICLGHQLLALSLGATTGKLKFGHRGGNQPVQNTLTGRVEITSQNHGFHVDTESLTAMGAVATHINLNDQTLAGFAHAELPIFAVQYHPEASPGPHDSSYLFDCFVAMMKTGKPPSAEQMEQAQHQRGQVATTEV